MLTFQTAQQIAEPVDSIKGDVENIKDGRFSGWWTTEHVNKELLE